MGRIKQGNCSRCSRVRDTNHCWCKSCNAKYQKQRNRALGIPERKGPYKQDQHLWRCWHSAKHRAKIKGLEFDLDLFKLQCPQMCPVLGIPLDRRDMQHSPSLDRVNTNEGYTHNNVRVISFRANSIKQDASLEELEAVVNYVRRNC